MNRDILILDENQPVDDSVMSRQSEVPTRNVRPRTQGGESLCESLKLAREARNLDIRTVASSLKIKPEQLESLEAGSVDAFPKFYALGFLRTYAAYLGEEALGFSANEAVARFKEEREHFQKAQSLAFPVAITEARLPEAPVLLGSAFLAALIYGVWFMMAGASLDGSDHVPGVPAKLVAETEAIELPVEDLSALSQDLPDPAAGQREPEVIPTDTIGAAAPAESAVEPIEVASRPVELPAETERQVPVSQAPVSNEVTGTGSEPRVVLRAKRDAWVRIDGAGDATILNGVMHAGDHVAAPDHGEIKITTANAGAFEIVVDGESVGRMGEEGQIQQNVSVDIDRLLGLSVRTN